MDLSDFPGGLACPSRASSWVTHPPRGISRVASLSLYRHAVANTPVRPWLGSFRSPVCHDGGLPHHLAGSAPTFGFSRPAQRSLTLRPACSRNHQVVLCIEGFGDFVPPPPLRLLPAGAKAAGWELHPLKIDAFARHTR